MGFFEGLVEVFKDIDLLLNSLLITLLIAAGALLVGFVIGILCAVIRIAPKRNPIVKVLDAIARFYVTIIRGTPTLLQLLIMANVVLVSINSSNNNLIIPILAFGLNSGAYMSEIIRSGFNSVPSGQLEAGRSLGLTWGKTVVKIIIPQAIKTVIPTIFNEIIVLVKETSVVAYIPLTIGKQVYDLLGMADKRGLATGKYMAYIIVAALLYLIIVILLTQVQKLIERKFRKNERR